MGLIVSVGRLVWMADAICVLVSEGMIIRFLFVCFVWLVSCLGGSIFYYTLQSGGYDSVTYPFYHRCL